MIDPSESARRIASTFQRFGVTLDGDLAGKDANVFVAKRGLGLALPAFVERVTDELEKVEFSPNAIKVLKLRLKQMNTVAEDLMQAGATDRFEPEELALVASLIDVTVAVMAAATGSEYRSESP